MLEKFKVLGLSEKVIHLLLKKGFEEPTRIQQLAIPLLLKKDIDIVAQAQTGTGKTAAFGLPILERIDKGSKHVQALVLTPTRELALQVAEEMSSFKVDSKVNITAVYGGQSIEQQIRRLTRGVDIVVGTPGRIKDHIYRKTLNLNQVSYVVLDEADEMLNMGFIDDVEEILSHTSKNKRMLLFSATMPDRILELAKKYMKDYQVIRTEQKQLTVELTEQIYFEVRYPDKLEALSRIIDSEVTFYGLIFCRTKVDVDDLTKKLSQRGYDVEGLHGDFSQHQRERVLEKFKQQRINILVATDVAARGIDITGLTHVINYSLPQDPESYVHRIGRTGRAGKEGTAITFVTPDEYRKLIAIKRITKTDIRKEKIPEITEVIDSKKKRIAKDVQLIMQSEKVNEYRDFAKELLKEGNSEDVLSAFIKYACQDELNMTNYNEIRDVSIDNKGTTRLFVARGKADNMTPIKLISMINEVVSIDSRKIRDIRIFENFSFITAPFTEAELILEAFKRNKADKRPIVARAKEPNKSRPPQNRYPRKK